MNCSTCNAPYSSDQPFCYGCGKTLTPSRGTISPTHQLLTVLAGLVLLFIFTAAAGCWIYWKWMQAAQARRAARIEQLRKSEKPVDLQDLHGEGRIYLVPFDKQVVSMDALAQHYRDKFHLDVQVLPPVAARTADFDGKQLAAEGAIQTLQEAYPELAADRDAYLMAVTNDDLHMRSNDWAFTYSYRDRDRSAVISSARMTEAYWEPVRALLNLLSPEHRRNDEEARVRKVEQMLTKYIAVQYWRLPMNQNPESILLEIFTPDGLSDDIWASDLSPEDGAYGRFDWCPVLYLRYTRRTKTLVSSGLTTCRPAFPAGDDDEVIVIGLTGGNFDYLTVQLNVPVKVPLLLRRSYTSSMERDAGNFGVGSSHTYNSWLGSDGLGQQSFIEIDGPGTANFFWRTTPGKGFDPNYRFRGTTEGPFGGAELYWSRGHYQVDTPGGDHYQFYPCDAPTAWCYWYGYTDHNGATVNFEREKRLYLNRVYSPGASIDFTYEGSHHVTALKGSNGDWRQYEYDPQGCLAAELRPDGTSTRYVSDEKCKISRIAFVDGAREQKAISFVYEEGRITKIDAGRDLHYTLNYKMGPKFASEVSLKDASGKRFHLVRAGEKYRITRAP